MITTLKHNGIAWINLASPSAKEINDLAENYSIHPLVAEELSSLTMRSKVDAHPESLYLVLHFPSNDSLCADKGGCEIDLVIGRNFLITSHYCDFPALERFFQGAKTRENLRNKYFQNHAGMLAFHLLKELYETSLNQLDQLQIKINKTEEEIFKGKEKEMVKRISLVRQDILNFRRSIYQHEGILSSLEQIGRKFFGEKFGHYLNLLSGEYAKIKNLIEDGKETIETLHQTNESLLTTKTNEIMKILTIMAFATFPLMLISSVFGMNTVFTPILGRKMDFWIILAIMAIATIGIFLCFKKKKWL